MARHPNNGPSFSKPTIKRKLFALSAPDRQKAKADEDARDAVKQRQFRTLFRNDPAAWFAEYFQRKE
jgi:hypothetical protein